MEENNRTRRPLRLAVSAALCAFLAACAYEVGGPSLPGQAPVGGAAPIYGLEQGSHLRDALTGGDRDAIARAAGALVSDGQSGASQSWNGGSGDSGQLRLGGSYLVGLDVTAGAPVEAPAGIDASVALAPASGNYVATKTANVRLGANLSSPVAQTLNQGTVVRAYGYDKAGDWYLVGVSDAVLGYVSGKLLQASGGTEPVLAGGSPRSPQLCRNITITASLSGSANDSWSAFVCKTAQGWAVPSERGLS